MLESEDRRREGAGKGAGSGTGNGSSGASVVQHDLGDAMDESERAFVPQPRLRPREDGVQFSAAASSAGPMPTATPSAAAESSTSEVEPAKSRR